MPRKWTRVHEQQVKRILDLMKIEARPFADTSPEAIAARKALPFDGWCKLYLPHYFYAPSAPAHLIADELVEEEGMPLFLHWARGFAKSVRYGLAKPVRWIVEKARHFVICGGRDEDVAVDKMDLVKLELENNPRLRADYGNELGPHLGSNEDADWTACDTRVIARGIGQSPRGLLHRQYRPDVFIGDDLEDDILARNPRREQELEDWIFGTVFPGLESAGTKALCVCLLNTFQRGCLSARAREKAGQFDKTGRPLCRYHRFPAVDEQGHSTWPARYSDQSLARAQAVMGTRLFRREMRCLEDDESSAFRPDWIRHFKASDFDRSTASVVAYCDPSARAAECNDYKALIVLGRPVGSEETHCLHAWIRHASVGEMIEEMFRIRDHFAPGRFACEDNGFQTLIWPLLSVREKVHGRVGLIPVTNTASKDDRILSNVGDFEQGLVYFDPAEGDQKLLIDQFLDFKKPDVHDDGPDAFAGAKRFLPRLGSGLEEFRYRGIRRTNYEAILA
jgi:hypothetical protein